PCHPHIYFTPSSVLAAHKPFPTRRSSDLTNAFLDSDCPKEIFESKKNNSVIPLKPKIERAEKINRFLFNIFLFLPIKLFIPKIRHNTQDHCKNSYPPNKSWRCRRITTCVGM